MSDVATVASAACVTISVACASQAYVKVKLAQIRASVAGNAHEFAMMEKIATPKKGKAKTVSPIPYGL